MTYINNTIMLIEEVAGNMSDKHNSTVQDNKIWSSLRTHIMSRREKNKQGKFSIAFKYLFCLSIIINMKVDLCNTY